MHVDTKSKDRFRLKSLYRLRFVKLNTRLLNQHKAIAFKITRSNLCIYIVLYRSR